MKLGTYASTISFARHRSHASGTDSTLFVNQNFGRTGFRPKPAMKSKSLMREFLDRTFDRKPFKHVANATLGRLGSLRRVVGVSLALFVCVGVQGQEVDSQEKLLFL